MLKDQKILKIKGTSDTPEVILDPESNKFMFSGVSLPPNIFEFYDPIIEWIKEYSLNSNQNVIFEFQFDYLNSSSIKVINDIIFQLEQVYNNDQNVSIKWYYERGDEEMKEAGEDFVSYFKIPIIVTLVENV